MVVCDVIWAPPECIITSESPYDVIEQLRAGYTSKKVPDWLMVNDFIAASVNGRFNGISDNEKVMTLGGIISL